MRVCVCVNASLYSYDLYRVTPFVHVCRIPQIFCIRINFREQSTVQNNMYGNYCSMICMCKVLYKLTWGMRTIVNCEMINEERHESNETDLVFTIINSIQWGGGGGG